MQAYVIDDALYRVWDHWIADGKRPVVFAVDVATGKHRNLFAGHEAAPARQRRRRRPTTTSRPTARNSASRPSRRKELGTDFNRDLYAMPLDKPRRADRTSRPTIPANDFDPVYSPDGKSIAFLRQTTKFFYADRARLMLHDRATGKNRELTAELRSLRAQRRSGRPTASGSIFEAEDKGYHPPLRRRRPRDGDVTPLDRRGYSDHRARR